MKPLSLLVVTASNTAFNSLRPEAEIYIEMARRGHDVTMVTHADSEYGRRYAEQGIRVIDRHPDKKISLASIRAIRAELRSKPYDILFATSSKSIPNAAFAAIGIPVTLITYRGTTGGLYRHDPSAYLTHLHPRVNGIICVSNAVREDVLARVWKNHERIRMIHKGHDLAWYDKPPADLTEFGIEEGDFTAICAVNARPSKGIEVMIEAANELADIDNFQLLLAGKNMDQEPYTSLIQNNRMRDRIHVAGYRLDAPELIVASDVLVQPSVSGEGLPRAVMEAMAYGTPPIITTTGGGKEVVDDGVNGFVVPVRDPQAIASRLRQLHADRELLERMSQQCKQKLANELSLQRTVDHFIEFFEAVR